jgi:hypothetical protein
LGQREIFTTKLIRLKNNYGNKGLYKGALLQIVDGVSTANEALQDKGASIPTKGLIGEGVLFRVEEDNTTKHCIKVDFDIAVALTQEESTKLEGSIRTSGEGKLNIVPLLSKVGLGVNANGAASRETKDDGQTIHRIRCTIPLSLPDSLNE